MQKEPFANIEARLDKSASRVFKLDPPVHKPGEQVEGFVKDASLAGEKNQFVITDVSNVKDKKMFIRDVDGKVRHASASERWYQKHAKPKYLHNR